MTQIQFRRGTAAEWTSANPELASAEFGFETDTGKFKIGAGYWNSLDYIDAPTVLAETAVDVLDDELASRAFGLADDGEGGVVFASDGVPTGGPSFELPGAAWSTLAGRPSITFVSEHIANPLLNTAGAVQAAITEAIVKDNGVVDFEGVHYVTESTVTASMRVTLVNGGIVPTGQFRALSVTGDDVTVRDMTFSRSTAAGVLDDLAQRSCVSVNAERFRSFDCTYLAANHSCVYLAHGACDGAVIRGGEMTGTSARQDAAGVYGASGATGSKNITVEDVHIHDTSMGVLLFDTGYSRIQDNRIEGLRVLPTVELTGWTLVSGNVWRQRSASGTPGVDGVVTDREDGSTLVATVDGVDVGGVLFGETNPGSGDVGVDGGYVYINLGGTDPNTVTVMSKMVAGYAVSLYVTGSAGANEPLTSYNRVIGNYAEDCDGFGVYLQLGYYGGSVGNLVSSNTLKDVVLEGKQDVSHPWSAICVHAGNDTLLANNTISGVGSPGKPAPGVYVSRGTYNTEPGGRIVGTTVRDGYDNGFLITASGWTLDGCHSHDNAGNGFRVWTNAAGAAVRNVTLSGCHGYRNTLDGFVVDGTISTINSVSAHIIGGASYDNGNRGIQFAGSVNPTVRDSAAIGVEVRDNGAGNGHAQIQVRTGCHRTTVDACHLASVTPGAVGLLVDAGAVDTAVGTNQASLTTPEILNTPVRTGRAGGAQWRYTGSPEGVVIAPVGATYQRSDGVAGATLYVKESGTGNTGWAPHAGIASVNTQAGTSYTPVLSDAGRVLRFTSGSAVTLTVPLNSSVTFPIGAEIELYQSGAGQVTVVPESVAVISSVAGANKISAQHGVARLRKVDSNVWTLSGDITT